MEEVYFYPKGVFMPIKRQLMHSILRQHLLRRNTGKGLLSGLLPKLFALLLLLFSTQSAITCPLSVTCPALNFPADQNTVYYQCESELPTCDVPGFFGIDAQSAINAACNPVDITCTELSFGGGCADDVRRIERTYTITDPVTLESVMCTTNFYIRDETKPTFDNCPTMPLVLECGQPFTTIVNNWLDNVTASDNCGGVTITNDYLAANLQEICTSELEGLIVTFTAEDDCGNTETCTGEIRLEDTTAPGLSDCPTEELVLVCGADNDAEIAAWLGAVTAVDLCEGNIPVTNDFNLLNLPPSCAGSPTPTLTVNFNAVDKCGNSSSCQGVVKLEDIAGPMMEGCPPDNLIVECGPNANATISAWLNTVTANDACEGGVFVSNDYNAALVPTNCGGGPPIIVNFLAQDFCGRQATCTGSLTLVDTKPPTMSNCPVVPLLLECGADNTQEINDWLAAVTAADDCDGSLTVSNDFDINNLNKLCSGAGVALTVNFSASDNCGNPVSCTGEIRLEDTVAPTLMNCPVAPLALECGVDNTTAIDNWLGTVTAMDVCDGAVAVDNDYDVNNLTKICPGDANGLLVTFTATDACNNPATCTGQIRLEDNTGPVLSNCPLVPLTLECGADNTQAITDWLASVTAVDACDGPVNVTHDYVAANLTKICSTDPSGLLVTFTATDDCGNPSTCTGEIRLEDTQPPIMANCPVVPLVLECGVNNDTAIADWLAAVTATDACDGPLAVTNDFDELNLATICNTDPAGLIVNFNTVDACGNPASCTGEIRLEDTTAPVLSNCPVANLVLECGADNSQEITDWLNAVTAADACEGTVNVSNDYLADNLSKICPGDANGLLVTFSAEDGCGNPATCSAMIILVDSTAPTLADCPVSNLELNCDDDQDALIAAWLAGVTATDACDGSITVTNDYDVANLGEPGGAGLTVVFTATDDCNNSDSCQAEIIILDELAPILSNCPSEILEVECGNEQQQIDDWLSAVTAVDVCSGAVVVTNDFDPDLLVVVDPGEAGLIVAFKAVDSKGNMSDCFGEIRLLDSTDPTFDQQDLPVEAVEVNCTEIPAAAALTATDGCAGGAINVDYSEVESNQTCEGSYTITRTWTALDESGNAVVHTQVITVNNTTPPSFVEALPQDVNGQCGAVPPAEVLTANGVCSAAPVTFEEETTSLACGSLITRTWTATDDCGLEAVHVQEITLADVDPPELTLAAIQTFPADAGACEATNVAVLIPQPSDNCDANPTMTITRADGLEMSDPFPVGCTIVSISFRDNCNNADQTQTQVCITDSEQPQFITCPSDIYTCDGTASWDDPVLDDNCSASISNITAVSGSVFPAGQTEVTITIMDPSGNQNACSFFVYNDPIFVDVTLSDFGGFGTLCNGGNEGFAEAIASGGDGNYSYNWSNGDMTAATSGLEAGAYQVTVQDGTGCGVVEEVELTEPEAIQPNEEIMEIQCPDPMMAPNGNEGMFSLNPTGGSGIYTYGWSSTDPAFVDPGTSSVEVANPATYTYTITDENGCSVTGSYEFLQPTDITFFGYAGNNNEGFSGNILPVYYNSHIIEIDGGTGDYTYEWDRSGYVRWDVDHEPGVSGETLHVTYADNAEWVVTVYDSNGCSSGELVFTNDVGIGGGNPSVSDLGIILDIDNFNITGADQGTGANGTIRIQVVGGVPPYIFEWDGPGSFELGPSVNLDYIAGLEYGHYEVTVTDSGDPQQYTEGFYWVPLDRRSGRLKAGDVKQDVYLDASPNPVVESTIISGWSSTAGNLRTELWDYQGKLVRVLDERSVEADQQIQVELDTDQLSLSSGLYIVKMISENQSEAVLKLVIAN